MYLYKKSSSSFYIRPADESYDDKVLGYCNRQDLNACQGQWRTLREWTDDDNLWSDYQGSSATTTVDIGNCGVSQNCQEEDLLNGCGCGCDYQVFGFDSIELKYLPDVLWSEGAVYDLNTVYTVSDVDCYLGRTYFIGYPYDYIHSENIEMYLYRESTTRWAIKKLNTANVWAYCDSTDITKCDGEWYVNYQAYYYTKASGSITLTTSCSDGSRSDSSTSGNSGSKNGGDHDDNDSSSNSGELNWWAWLLICLGVLVLLVVVIGVTVKTCQTRKFQQQNQQNFIAL